MLNLGLGFLLQARDMASGVFDRVGARLRGLSTTSERTSARLDQAVGSVGSSLGTLVGGVSSALGAVSIAREAAALEDALGQVRAVAAPTADELRRLEDAALRAGVATQFSPSEAAIGLRDLAQAGFSADEALALLVPTLDLAAGSLGELTPQEAGGLVSQALKAFGLQADDATKSVDQLLQSVNVFALSARELPLALGTASRGAQAAGQSLEETLITLGLVKNIIPGVERASTAVATAMGEIATPRAQRQLRGLGVAVVDAEGQFRDFLDVLVDLEPALGRMTEQKRAAFLREAFGSEALAGVLAVTQQLKTGVRGASGEMLRGAAAVDYLRQQFSRADGTAGRFRDTLLDTFRGQWSLLIGAIQTLGVAVAKPVLEAMTPLVRRLAVALRAVTEAFLDLPPAARKVIGVAVASVAGLTAVAGALTAVRSATGLLRLGMGALGVEFGGVLPMLMRFAPPLAALALVLAALRVAYKTNLGGFRDLVVEVAHTVSLAVRGLTQLFSDGGFSGAVRDELAKAEHSGLRRFVIGVYMLAHRVRALFAGIAAGFRAGIEAGRPVFEALGDALRDLGLALARLVGELTGSANALPSDSFRAFGQVVGQVLAGVVRVVAYLGMVAARVVGGVVEGFTSMVQYLRPAFQMLGDVLGTLMDALGDLFGVSGKSGAAASSSASGWRRFGQILGKVVGGALTVLVLALSGAIKVLTWIVRVLDAVITAIARFVGAIIDGVQAVVRFLTQDVPAAFAQLGRGIRQVFEGIWQFLVDIKEEIVGIVESIANLVEDVVEKLENTWKRIKSLPGRAWGGVKDLVSVNSPTAPAGTSGGLPLMTPPSAVTGAGTSILATEASARVAALAPRGRAPGMAQLNVRLDVDGETLARTVRRVQLDEDARGFTGGIA